MSTTVKEKKFNKEYFNLWKELPFFISAYLLFKGRKVNSSDVLIFTPCLIGEFAAAIPSIRDYIKRNKENNIDIVVTPNLKHLAERIIGVRSIYTTKTIYGRDYNNEMKEQFLGKYFKVIVMRTSPDLLRILKTTKAQMLETNLLNFLSYASHLVWHIIIGKTPKRWRTFNFDMLHGIDKHITFDDIFNFKEKDYVNIEKLQFYNEKRNKIVIIHTNTGWQNKNWDNEKWAQLLERINKKHNVLFVIVGSDESIETYDHISSKLSFKTHSVINKLNLIELLILFRRADYYIGIDSGPSNLAHLAELSGITMIGVSPNMYLPHNDNHTVIDKTNNRGIFHLFFQTKKNQMDKISVDDVEMAFSKLYNNKHN